MKRFLFIALGAALIVVQGLIEWLINGNEAISSLPFALATWCLLLASSMPKKQNIRDIFDDLGTVEIGSLIFTMAVVVAFIVFVFRLMMLAVFPYIEWQYCLAWTGVIITAILVGKLFYFGRSMWSYIMGTDFFGY